MPGPYVQMATICEKVLQEPDGVISVIRSVDRLILTAHGTGLPDELPVGNLQVTLVVALKSDDATGRHQLTITVHLPSGQSLPPRPIDVMFEGAERGVNLILNIEIEAIEGLYWFDVALNEGLLTRVPLRVMYQRAMPAPTAE